MSLESFAEHAYSPHDEIVAEIPLDQPKATFAGGCFWCTESEFRRLDGVLYTRVGYTGGKTENPTYQTITTGRTGHAEALEIYFDPEIISYEKLVHFFLTVAHDPTQMNRQGVDVGTQYRSAIFPHSKEQEEIANKVIMDLNTNNHFSDPIVTTIEPEAPFWLAEEYHQQYYEKYEEKAGIPHIRVLYKLSNPKKQ